MHRERNYCTDLSVWWCLEWWTVLHDCCGQAQKPDEAVILVCVVMFLKVRTICYVISNAFSENVQVKESSFLQIQSKFAFIFSTSAYHSNWKWTIQIRNLYSKLRLLNLNFSSAEIKNRLTWIKCDFVQYRLSRYFDKWCHDTIELVLHSKENTLMGALMFLTLRNIYHLQWYNSHIAIKQYLIIKRYCNVFSFIHNITVITQQLTSDGRLLVVNHRPYRLIKL